MKLRPFPLLSLLVAVSLLVQGASLPVTARTEPKPAEPAASITFSYDDAIDTPEPKIVQPELNSNVREGVQVVSPGLLPESQGQALHLAPGPTPSEASPTLIAGFYTDPTFGSLEIWDLQTMSDGASVPFVRLMKRDETDLYGEPPGVQTVNPLDLAGFSCDQVSEIPKSECQALVILFNSTNGPGWKSKAGWLTNNRPCSWYHVTCQGGHVSKLDLWSNQLTGIIPRELGALTELQELILSWNQLSGEIPSELGNLVRLTELTLEKNKLTGTIPLWTCNLHNLQGFSLTDNQLHGTIPSCLGGLTNLTRLSLFLNQFTGGIPKELGNLTKLTFINLQSNQLTGSIPPEFGNLTNLTMLFLHSNQLTGPIPPQLGNLTKLEWLFFTGNQLVGVIPPQLGNLTKLQELGLDVNRLDGAIPAELGHLSKLYSLRLGRNALEGEIPGTFTGLVSLNIPPWPGYPAWSEISYNKLSASSPGVVDFLNAKLPGWSNTQTAPPTGLGATGSAGSADLNWNLIPYTQHGGYYEIGSAMVPGGPYGIVGRTSDKNKSSYKVGNLLPGRTYYFAVRTYTPSHDAQQNNLLSRWSLAVSATTRSPSIMHIEITQATQDEGNNVPLIEGKPTFVRVYLDCGEGCSAMPGVTGVLEVSGPAGGASLNPISQPVTAYHPASWTTQRGELGKTLNFAVPNQLMVAGQVTFTARAGVSSRSETRTVQAANALRVAQIPIHYLACGFDTTPDMSAVTTVHSLAQNLLPVGGDTPIAVETWPEMYWSTPLKKNCSKPATVDNINEENVILLLRTIEAQWFIHGGSNPPDYIFGWLPAGAFDRGVAWPRPPALYGVAAFSDVFASEDPLAEFAWSKVTFVHELGHLMGHNGINTPDCPSDDPGAGWPWSDAKIHDWGVDSTYFGWSSSSTSVLKNPQTTYDYMSYCGWKTGSAATWNLWTSAWTYTTALPALAARQVAVTASDTQPYFLVSGSVSVNDTAVLDPVWVITPTVTPALPPVGTAYCVEAQAGSGVVLSSHCFDLAFRLYETGAASNVDGFNLMLPYPPGIARIVLKKGATELTVRTVSAHAPVVDVLSPNGGETWATSGTYTITWTASDLDNDPLTYSVLYSPDGNNWVPVGTAITTTQLAVNAAELAGGTAARVRVLVTDGVNTSSDESDATFTVGRKGPSAFILAPEGEVRFMPGTPLWLQGYGYDLEDGTLEGAALRWRSDRDGDLGTESQALVTLSPGWHVITLAATDKDGNHATASINVYAGGKTYLPLVVRGQ